nr:gliding motility-associated C-terminal domain-containing protein [Ferruginibacter sp.]
VNGNLLVSVAPPVNVEAGSGTTIAAGQTVQLNGSGDAGNYNWAPAGSLSVANIPNPVASPTVTTLYTLVITNATGCSGSDVVEIQVIPECAKPMEAITPNGDGINDKWLVTYGNCITAARVKVFNRYGSSVFETENYQNNWEGTYKGKPLPDATYYYVIEYKQANNITVMLKGNLTIIR